MPIIITGLMLVALVLVYLLLTKPSPRSLSGRALRRKLAQSRREFIGKSEQWHWQRMKQRDRR